MINKKEILLQLKTRYFIKKEDKKAVENIWIACHGYGQLASYFIKNFESLSDAHMIIAPEGLNRFYVDGLEGRVGASWMTKEDRLSDIENYLHQLDQIWEHETQTLAVKNKIAFGFSQGTATISRWLKQNRPEFDALIMWAGRIAHDIELEENKVFLKRLKIIYVLGTDDPFINEKHIQAELARWDKIDITPQLLMFEGGHRIEIDALKELTALL